MLHRVYSGILWLHRIVYKPLVCREVSACDFLLSCISCTAPLSESFAIIERELLGLILSFRVRGDRICVCERVKNFQTHALRLPVLTQHFIPAVIYGKASLLKDSRVLPVRQGLAGLRHLRHLTPLLGCGSFVAHHSAFPPSLYSCPPCVVALGSWPALLGRQPGINSHCP